MSAVPHAPLPSLLPPRSFQEKKNPCACFVQVWHLSDIDSNQLLSKPEFCLFMYLMHALRNFGSSFRLPEHITPNQAARILGLEGLVRGGGGSAGAPHAGPSSQGVNPAPAYSGNGGFEGPQQGPQQAGGNDWEATGGLSPSQQQAVQEMTALGFSPQQCQVCRPTPLSPPPPHSTFHTQPPTQHLLKI